MATAGSSRRAPCSAPGRSAGRPPLRHEVAVGRRREVDDHRHVHAQVVRRPRRPGCPSCARPPRTRPARRRTACAPSTPAGPAGGTTTHESSRARPLAGAHSLGERADSAGTSAPAGSRHVPQSRAALEAQLAPPPGLPVRDPVRRRPVRRTKRRRRPSLSRPAAAARRSAPCCRSSPARAARPAPGCTTCRGSGAPPR